MLISFFMGVAMYLSPAPQQKMPESPPKQPSPPLEAVQTDDEINRSMRYVPFSYVRNRKN